jgi:DNA-directed RNA polymerase II subunit RPB7
MFFHIVLEKNIQLAPKYFGQQLQQTLRHKLAQDVEGQCTGRYGYIITVTEIVYIGKGKINESNGHSTFPIKYKAIVFRPFKNEVLDAVVTTVNKVIFVLCVLCVCDCIINIFFID